MLNKYIIHLKNVMFFKFVVYLILIIALLVILPWFREDLNQSISRKEKVANFVKEINNKLRSVVDVEDRLEDMNTKYSELVNSANKSCFERTQFLDTISKLEDNKEVGDFENVNVEVIKLNNDAGQNRNDKVRINSYRVTISFAANDQDFFKGFSRYLIEIMPKGAIITHTEFDYIETLTPEIISRLSEGKTPKLFNVKVELVLREITYEYRT